MFWLFNKLSFVFNVNSFWFLWIMGIFNRNFSFNPGSIMPQTLSAGIAAGSNWCLLVAKVPLLDISFDFWISIMTSLIHCSILIHKLIYNHIAFGSVIIGHWRNITWLRANSIIRCYVDLCSSLVAEGFHRLLRFCHKFLVFSSNCSTFLSFIIFKVCIYSSFSINFSRWAAGITSVGLMEILAVVGCAMASFVCEMVFVFHIVGFWPQRCQAVVVLSSRVYLYLRLDVWVVSV